MIEICPFEDRFASAFKEMNLEWLDKYGLTESHDLQVLDDPRGTIIEPGGYIFLAMEEGIPVGSAALMKERDNHFELAKMSVIPAMRGRGISKLLISRCINKAIESGAEKLFLFSNHQLTTALQLYTGFGFSHVPVVDSPFETADVRMELDLVNFAGDKKNL
jgi:GNAT superfamily N-acetyltransferase